MSETDARSPGEEHDVSIDPDDELQFDQAEFTTSPASGPACGVCQRPISDVYYEISGKVVCAACRQGMEAALRGGSPLFRALGALMFGAVAAVAGAMLYYLILRTTGYNIGLVAVVVGAMVGGAVRRGTGNRGGVFYQILAVFLTYSAIVAMYVPLLYEEFAKGRDKERQAELVAKKVATETKPAQTAPKTGPNPQPKTEPKTAAIAGNESARTEPKSPVQKAPLAKAPPKESIVPTPELQVADVKKQADANAQKLPPVPGPGKILAAFFIGIIIFLLFLYSIPVQIAVAAPISGLIFAFALWEAWKLNKPLRLTFQGPFRIGARGDDERPEVDSDAE
jgi:hypothetical protein